jgi:hypothetical protein
MLILSEHREPKDLSSLLAFQNRPTPDRYFLANATPS